MKLEITPQRAKDALIGQLKRDSAHVLDLLNWGSWTLVAEFAEKLRENALAVRRLEMTPEGLGQQEMKDLIVPRASAEFLNFEAGFLHQSPDLKQAANR
jgi:hypothetical protein